MIRYDPSSGLEKWVDDHPASTYGEYSAASAKAE
jgi:hypothetical protein